MYAAPPVGAGPMGAGPVGAWPRMMFVPRVQRHLQTLGYLWLGYAVLRFVTGLMGAFFLRTFARHGWDGNGWMWGGPMRHGFGPDWMAGLVPMVMAATIMSVALSLATGYSLLTRRPWGRVLGIVAAILALIKFPLGTALGIFTLYVLAPSQSGAEYDAIADRT